MIFEAALQRSRTPMRCPRPIPAHVRALDARQNQSTANWRSPALRSRILTASRTFPQNCARPAPTATWSQIRFVPPPSLSVNPGHTKIGSNVEPTNLETASSLRHVLVGKHPLVLSWSGCACFQVPTFFVDSEP